MKPPVPVTNLYKTPQTLGMDRLAAVVAANWLKLDTMCWLLTQEPVSHTILLTLTEPIMEAIFLQECVCVSRH